jgi:hypothetical protein
VTGTVIALVAVILGRAAALALSVAQLFEEQMGQRDRDLGRRLADPVRFTETLGLSATFLAPLGPARATPSSPASTPNWSRTSAPLAHYQGGSTMSVKQYRVRPRP